MPEPIAVAFVEVLPDLAGFRAATQAEIARTVGATKFTVPPLAGAAAARTELGTLAAAAGEATSAETLLAQAQAKLQTATAAGALVEGDAAKAHLRRAAAAEADAAAQRALFAITSETNAATVAEIDALVTATGSLNAKAAAEERAAFATRAHATAAREGGEALLAEAATVTGLRGASLGVNPAFLAATAGAVTFFKSVEVASGFEEQMHQIEFATHASAAELEHAAKVAEGFGRATKIFQASALDAVTVIRDLTESGQSLNEAYAETPAVLNLATAAELSHSDAVRTTIQLLDAYHLSADQATEVTDSIAIAGKSAAGSAEDFAQSLRVVAPVAQAFGLSIRDTTTLLIQMVQGGVSASQAGSLLRQALLRLTNPSNQAREALKSIGIDNFRREFLDLEGNLRPDAFERLALALSTVNKEQQRNVLTTIFSRRAVTALLTITGDQRASYEETAKAAHHLGVAQEEAAEKSRGLHGQTKELKDDLSDLGLQIGTLVIPPLTFLVKGLDLMARGISDAQFVVESLGKTLLTLGKDLPISLTKSFTGEVVHLANEIPGVGTAAHGAGEAVKHAFSFGFGGVTKAFDGVVSHFQHGDDDIKLSVEDMRKKIQAELDLIIGALKVFSTVADQETHKVSRSLDLSGQLAVAQATGTQAQQLSILREQQANQQAALTRKQRLFKEGKINEQAVINQANQLEQTNAAIASILSEQQAKAESAAQDAKSKADKIVQAQNERDQALINAISSEQTRREAKVQAAASSQNLTAEINAQIALRNFFQRSIQETQKRIREARAEGRSTQALRDELQTLRLAKSQVRREIEQLRRENRQQAEQTRIESAQLDVEFASIGSTSGVERSRASVNREIRARLRLIAALRKAQSHVKQGTLEWKRLRNEIAQEQQAIRDLKKQTASAQADQASFQQQAFKFLTEQQGFASNLAGNLLSSAIPGVNTGFSTGTATFRAQAGNISVRPIPTLAGRTGTAGGGISRGQSDLTGQGGQIAEALRRGQSRGATTAQMNTLIRIARRTNELLGDLKTGLQHPEAHQHRKATRARTETSVD